MEAQKVFVEGMPLQRDKIEHRIEGKMPCRINRKSP